MGSEGIVVAVRVRPLNKRETTSVWRPLPQYSAITQLGPDGEPLQGSHAVFNVSSHVVSRHATPSHATRRVHDTITRLCRGGGGKLVSQSPQTIQPHATHPTPHTIHHTPQ